MSISRSIAKSMGRMAHRATSLIVNYGYSESGASTTKKSVAGWKTASGSPQQDIDQNLGTLRARSRSLFMNSTIPRSAIMTNRTNVVGSGLKLKSRVDFQTLGMTREDAGDLERKIEKQFELWARSKHCDVTKVNDFYEMQQLALISKLTNGDAFAAITYKKEPYSPYSLKIRLIEADRVCNPNTFSDVTTTAMQKLENGNCLYSGVEINDTGEIKAYHLCNQHPSSMIFHQEKTWTRVQAFGKLTGKQNILQLMESERPDQYRGVPYLAPVIEALKQLERYTKAELTSAVVQSFFSVFVKQEAAASEEGWTKQYGVDGAEEAVDELDPTTYELGSGTVQYMEPGESIEMADPKRPNTGFDVFTNAVIKQIGAALEIPHELIMKSFMASYSASRAALLEAWKAFKMRRVWFANDFCTPIYEAFLDEAVSSGRINAPGYFNDPSIRMAYAGAEWIGPSQGQLDPVKEVTAAKLRVDNGFSTRERETTELTGGSFDDNAQHLVRENKSMSEANSAGMEVINNEANVN